MTAAPERYQVWVGAALFVTGSPGENRAVLAFVECRWWRFGSAGTPVVLFDNDKEILRFTLGELGDVLGVLGMDIPTSPGAKEEGRVDGG